MTPFNCNNPNCVKTLNQLSNNLNVQKQYIVDLQSELQFLHKKFYEKQEDMDKLSEDLKVTKTINKSFEKKNLELNTKISLMVQEKFNLYKRIEEIINLPDLPDAQKLNVLKNLVLLNAGK